MTDRPGASDLSDPPAPAQPAPALYETAARLLQGARAGHDLAESLRLLIQASAGGHTGADTLLAVMSGMGVGMVQGWDPALDHLQRAAERGSVPARGQLLALAGADMAAAADPGDGQTWLRLRRSIRLEPWLAPPEKTVLSRAPRVVSIRNFLSLAVCDWIIGRARGRVQRALVHDVVTAAGGAGSGRTNTAFEFGFLDLDLVVLLVRARIAATIGFPVAILEAPQVLHYDVGERYARHHDYFDPRQPGHSAQIAARGQRIVTFLIYLNTAYEGGETDFPLIGLRHRGGPGDALYFGNVDPRSVPDPRTLHAGLAPTQGEKWLLSQWVRDRPPV
jgi:prolyl 4-hydroxylase